MKSFWLFRSNLRHLEYYHAYKTLKEFKEKCHDFYLLQGIWFLENDKFDEVVIWRLQPKNKVKDIVFDINGKKFIQKWVNDFNECLKYPSPEYSFFRGGFREYDNLVKQNSKHLGHTLYLGAGIRTRPEFGGHYHKTLVEDEMDMMFGWMAHPFYKTCNPNIFKPLNLEKKYDLIWICNNTQITQKGQGFFIKEISDSEYLKSLKILHVGNKPQVGKNLCNKYNVNNIIFNGLVDRLRLNKLINQSKFGIVTSNNKDGCPRVLTEIMCTGTPLIVRVETRFLDYYKDLGVVGHWSRKEDLDKKIKQAFDNYDDLKREAISNLNNKLTYNNICRKNLEVWDKRWKNGKRIR